MYGEKSLPFIVWLAIIINFPAAKLSFVTYISVTNRYFAASNSFWNEAGIIIKEKKISGNNLKFLP